MMFELTSNQKSIWFDQILYSGSALYNVGGYISISGKLDNQLFARTLDIVIAQNDALRIRFIEEGDDPMLLFADHGKYELQTLDFSAEANPKASCLDWMEKQAQQAIGLNESQLFRFQLLKASEDQYFWYIKLHHLVSDGWSVSLIVSRVAEAYTALAKGEELPEACFSFRDAIEDDLIYRESDVFSADRSYWEEKLAGLGSPLNVGKPLKAKEPVHRSGRKSFFLERDFYDRLNALALANGASVFHVFLGVLYTYFSRSKQVNDLVIGIPILNRGKNSFKKTVGLFTGITPLRMDFPEGMTFSELLVNIKNELRENFRHQRFPIDEIHKLARRQDNSIKQLFEVSLSFEKHDYTASFDGFPSESVALPHHHEKLPLAIYVREYQAGEDVKMDIDYNLAYWDDFYIEQFTSQLRQLLQEVLSAPEQAITAYELLTSEQKALQLNGWNPEKYIPAKSSTIVELFEQQVNQSPGKIALVGSNVSLTYAELNEKVNHLAHELRNNFSVQPNDIIGILASRSEQTIISILGVLKAGAAYLPIDPAYPGERISYLIMDSGIKLLLADAQNDRETGGGNYAKIRIDETFYRQNQAVENPVQVNKPGDLCYVIYTSGSTGKPKGVMVKHQGFVNMSLEQVKQFDVTSQDRCLQFASFSFDASASEIFMAFFSGAALVLAPEEARGDTLFFTEFLEKKRISVLTLPPPFLSQLPDQALDGVKTLITAGEPALAKDALRFSKLKNYFNAYGPTETSVCAASYRFTGKEDQEYIPIGRPISNTSIYLLDPQLRLLPVGAVGEIYIGGSGVAAGYLKRPELTLEKFIPSPFHPQEILFKTGDLGRYLPDGNLVFAGRVDDQLKIRGHRVEPGEIEQALLKHALVKESAVVLQTKNGEQCLLAFYKASGEIDRTALQSHLNGILPGYMMPEKLIVLDSFPKTPHGKVDKKALAAYVLPEQIESKANDTEAQTTAETRICELWKEILGVNHVGVHDNFFDLGGHSLKATRFISRLYKEEGLRISLADMFNNPTVFGIAQLLPEHVVIADDLIETIEKQEYYELSDAQRQLWMAVQEDENAHAFNIPLAVVLNGEIDAKLLKKAIAAIVRKHEALRTVFVSREGRPYQQIREKATVEIETLQLEEPWKQAAELAAKHINHRFDLSRGPLFYTSLACIGEGKYLFFFTVHHLVSDGWSLKLMLDELTHNYKTLSAGRQIDVESLAIQYKDCVQRMNVYPGSLQGQKDREYWLTQLRDMAPGLNLPLDFERPHKRTYQGRVHHLMLGATLKQALSELAKESRSSIFVVLQTAVKVMLYKLCGQNDISVGTPVAGRTSEEMEKLIGFFVNTIVLRDNLEAAENFSELLSKVRSTTLRGMEHQAYPVHGLLEELGLPVQRNRNPLFDVLITMDDQHIEESNGFYDTGDSLLKELELAYTVSKFDLTFSFDTRGDEINISLVCSSDLFNAEKTALLGRYFRNILVQALADPAKPLESYSLFTGTEQELFNYLQLPESQVEAVFPLTAVQRDIYLTSVLNPEGMALRPLAYFIIREKVDPKRWKQALELFTEREPVLRTVLVRRESGVYQAVQKTAETRFEYVDLSAKKPQEKDFDRIVQEHLELSQDLDHPLIMHYLFKIAENCFLTALSVHHVLLDGTSFKTFYENLDRIYTSLSEGKEHEYGQQKTFREFTFSRMSRFDNTETEAFWRNRLRAAEPLAYSGALVPTDKHVSEQVLISEEETLKIKAFCRKNKLKAEVYFKAIYALLVKYYCNAGHGFCLRENLFGRSADYLDAVGCFMHTLPLPVDAEVFGEELTFEQFCFYIKAAKEEVKEHREISLSLQNRIIGEEALSFFYNYQKFFEPQTKLNMGMLHQLYHVLDSQVEIRVVESHPGFEIMLDYNEKIFNGKGFVSRMQLLSQQVLEGDFRVNELEYLLETEKEQLLRRFNPAEISLPATGTIVDLFEEQVYKAPGKQALIAGECSLTYRELNQRANAVALHLKYDLKIERGDVVGILPDRSEWMLIAMLGVLKSGAVYLPLDPAYPSERLSWMLDDSKAKVLLTHSSYALTIPFSGIISEMETIRLDPIRQQFTHTAQPGDMAYIIYTSGTTGRPKGVKVAHRSLVNAAYAWRKAYKLNKMQVTLLQLAGFSFDVFTGDVIRALTNGGKLVICPNETRLEFDSLYELIEKHRVSLFESTPALIVPLMDYIYANSRDVSFLELLILGSDSCPVEHFRKLLKRYGTTMRIVNSYGVTEATIDSGFYEGSLEHLPHQGNTPIGKPLQNTFYYVTNASGKLLPVGIPGELRIGGHGVSCGYHNKPELTAKKFIENPFRKGEKLYKTGDMVRWLPDGNLEFTGRNDEQVKVRGYRVELREIENCLLTHPQVEMAVVLAKSAGHNEKELVAFIVFREVIKTSELRNFLALSLPEFMLPAYFIPIDAVPQTPNGKVDRKALSGIQLHELPDENYEAPVTSTELQMALIWEEILQRPKIGLKDNFFTLGGHSLKAVSLASRIYQAFRIDVPLSYIFKNPTLKAISSFISNGKADQLIGIKVAPVQEAYPLSSSQKRLYLLQELAGTESTYNMPGALIIRGTIDKDRLENAFRSVIERHESLRTSFEMQQYGPVQKIHAEVSFQIRYAQAKQNDIDSLLADFIRPFDLSQAPLIRVSLHQLALEEHLLLFDMHHIISDGVSIQVLISELTAFYDGKSLSLPTIQPKDYAVWQQEYLASDEIARQENFWLQQFMDEPPVLEFPTDFQRPSVKTFAGDRLQLTLGREQSIALRNFALEHDCTLFQVMLAVYHILLAKYSGGEDIVTGIPVAARRHKELEHLLGMFVNTLAVRTYPQGNKSFSAFAQEVKNTGLACLENQDYPFELLIERLELKREMGRNPLFDTMFSFLHPEVTEVKLGQAVMKILKQVNKTAKFDLLLEVLDTTEIQLAIEYSTELFSKETIARLGSHFTYLLSECISNPQKTIAELQLLSVEEEKQLLMDFNDTYANYPHHACIHHLFEEQVLCTPDHTALVYENTRLTYSELNVRANLLVPVICNRKQGKSAIVAVMLDRSVEMVVALLAVLKSGNAYLPIDPDYPKERIAFMLEDSNADLLITEKCHCDKAGFDGPVIDVNEKFDADDSENLNVHVVPEDLAYIIYTSGSTGTPKGVMIEHRNVVRLLVNDKNPFHFNSSDAWTMFHSYCFDFSVWEMYGALLYGGKLVVVPKLTAQSPVDFLDLLEKEKITVLNQTPAAFYHLMDEENQSPEKKLQLRYVIFGGEALKPAKLKSWKARYPYTSLVNMYGITETTVHVTYKEIGDYEIKHNISNIGKPIPTLQLFVLDRYLNLLPAGVPGELCVAGDGLARAYLNRPELTSEKFIDHPFLAGEKLYRSGDLVKVLPGGDFEYLGRIDHQVKIRGFRVELGEIENRLLEHPAIKDAVVIDREDEDGNKYLCAYLEEKMPVAARELKSYLKEKLPEYMVPAWFITLDELPVTSNGKVNRKALPLPVNLLSAEETAVPVNPVEEKLLAVWQEILAMEAIGTRDNFFELGGHSLKASLMAAKAHKVLEVELPLKLVFSTPTIAELAAYIDRAGKTEVEFIPPASKQEFYPVSSAEKRMYILNSMDETGVAYNIPAVFTLEGTWDALKLEETLRNLVARHEILRTTFELKSNEIFRKIHETINFKLENHNLSEKESTAFIREFIRSFDLARGPLFRVAFVQSENQSLLLFDMHHLITDGVSIENLLLEMNALYTGQALPQLRIQYKDYAVWQQQWRDSAAYRKQREFWLEQFRDETPVLEIPSDFVRPAIKSFEGDRYNFTISAESSSAIRNLAAESGATPFMVLLAAYHILLSKYSGQDDFVIGTPVAGRSSADLEKVLGMFVNTLPLRNRCEAGQSFIDFMEEVRNNVLGAFQHQDYPFEELLGAMNIQRDMSRNPLFDYMFTYLPEGVAALEFEGLKMTAVSYEHKISKMDLSLEVSAETDGTFSCSIEYCTAIFRRESIERLGRHFVKVVEEVSADQNILVKEIELLTSFERKQIIEEFNHTSTAYPKEKTLVELFESQVAKTPEQAAVVYNGQQMSYSDLDQKADVLAKELQDAGIRPDDRVGILLKRSGEAIEAMFGVLKSGGAYVYIDPDFPAERIERIISDSGIKVLITEEKEIQPVSGIHFIDIHRLQPDANGQRARSNVSSPASLAYIIYTSGSSGAPKGVAIEQKSIMNLSHWFSSKYQLHISQNVLQTTNLSFDVSVEESIIPLLNGATVFVAPKEVILDKKRFRDFIVENDIHIAQFVPATLRSLLAENSFMPSLKTVICGGEKLEESLKNKVLEMGYKLYNHYGPTETTVDSLSWDCETEDFAKTKMQAVHRRFEDAARRFPDATAVEINGKHISYAELNRKANRLAHRLIELGAGGDKVIGIMAERSIELIAGILAILKSGAAYLPVDPGYPVERINYMLENSASEILLTQNAFREKIDFSGDMILLDSLGSYEDNENNPDTETGDKNLAYVIYTSGSTGKPKGVQIEHGSLNNFLFSLSAKFNGRFNEKDVCMSLTNISFDVSVFEIFVPLVNGAKLVLLEGMKVFDLHFLARTLVDQQVSFTYIPPALLQDLFRAITAISDKIALNKLIVGVEPIKDTILEAYISLNSEMQIINGYGPTETTISSSIYIYDSRKASGTNVPIGKPIHNTRIYILDAHNKLQPVGVAGELCIAGDGLARGYLNSPELTAEKFVPNPFEPGQRMYRTGDLAKWLPDGNIEFIGRKDYQVKIRGFRIEPGEIESRLLGYRAISQVLVIDREDKQGGKYLCAYYISDENPATTELRRHLAKELPDYMIPAYFVQMDRFPLTKNGKTDRKALPEPLHEIRLAGEFSGASGEVEKQLAKIWCELLDLEKVSVNDNFFELGGNSLKIIVLFGRIREIFGETVQVSDLFDKPSIRELAAWIEANEDLALQKTEPVAVKRAKRVEF